MKSVFSQYTYLKNFVAPVIVKTFQQDNLDNNSLIILSESEEVANFLIDQQVGDVLSRIGALNVHDIQITDQKLYNNL